MKTKNKVQPTQLLPTIPRVDPEAHPAKETQKADVHRESESEHPLDWGDRVGFRFWICAFLIMVIMILYELIAALFR